MGAGSCGDGGPPPRAAAAQVAESRPLRARNGSYAAARQRLTSGAGGARQRPARAARQSLLHDLDLQTPPDARMAPRERDDPFEDGRRAENNAPIVRDDAGVDNAALGDGGAPGPRGDNEWVPVALRLTPCPFRHPRTPHATLPSRKYSRSEIRRRRKRGKSGVEKPWTVMDLWSLFAPSELLQEIVAHTNDYVRWLKQSERPWYAPERQQWPPKCIQDWKDLTEEELRKYMALRYMFGLLGTKAPYRDAWKTKSLVHRYPAVRAIMSRNRYYAIGRGLHFVNNDGVDVNSPDPFQKVRPLLESLRKASRDYFQPGEYLAVDEQMQTCNNRSCPASYHPPRKKTNGIKIWSLCDSSTGYLCAFSIAKHGGPKIRDMVRNLVADLKTKGHQVIMDNLFTTPELLCALREAGFNACGTWRRNFGVPDALKPQELKKLERGDFRWLMHHRYKLFGTGWKDTKLCNFLSNYHDPHSPAGYVLRYIRGEKKRVLVGAPQVAVDYNKWMGAVDRLDSLRASYTATRPCRRWYMALFVWWLDMIAIQSMIIYRSLGNVISHADYVKDIVMGLLGADCPEDVLSSMGRRETRVGGRKRRRPSTDGPAEGKRHCHMEFRHWPEEIEKWRRCAWCYNHHGLQRRIKLQCKCCKVALHAKCMEAYHLDLWTSRSP